jgi:hypothetical protein
MEKIKFLNSIEILKRYTVFVSVIFALLGISYVNDINGATGSSWFFSGGCFLISFGLVILSRSKKINQFEDFLMRVEKRSIFTFGMVLFLSLIILLFLQILISDNFLVSALKIFPDLIRLIIAGFGWLFFSLLFFSYYFHRQGRFDSKKALGILFAFFLLLLQHFVLFREHYFNDFGFPHDFNKGYYAIVAFWTSIVEAGVIPKWIPFQQMGYPVELNLQLGIHYLPFWIFPLAGITYTLNAAVAFQAAHIFFGSFGFYLFLRDLRVNPFFAILGGIAFQFFGGFYSNAQHPDIIRSYSLIPWLFYVFTLDHKNNRIPSNKNFFIPFFIFLLATGGYPGNLIATTFFLAIYVILQLLAKLKETEKTVKWALKSVWIFILTVLGFLISLFHLAPVINSYDYFARYQEIGNLNIMELDYRHLPGLFITNTVLPGDYSMSSTFVTLPVIILVWYISTKYLKKYWNFLVIGIIGVLMVGGPGSFFWKFVVTQLQPLQYSRFPASDYKIFVAISLIILAIGGIETITERSEKFFSLIAKSVWLTIVVVIIFVSGYAALGSQHPYIMVTVYLSLLIFFVMVGLILLYHRTMNIKVFHLVVGITILVLLNGFIVLPSIAGWNVPNISNIYESAYGFSLHSEEGKFKPTLLQISTPTSRPPRIEVNDHFDAPWRGYLSGEYLVNDISGNYLFGMETFTN